MPNHTDLTGLAGVVSAVCALLLLLPGVARLSRPRRAALLGGFFALMLIPYGGMPLAAYVRGVSGDLSITSLVLLWAALLQPWIITMDAGSRRALLRLIALAAVAFYPMALGVGAVDPYHLGFADPLFVTALLIITLAAWFWKLYPVALCIALATLAWAIGWYESSNLWDYLLDPFVSVYALAATLIYALRALSQSALPK